MEEISIIEIIVLGQHHQPEMKYIADVIDKLNSNQSNHNIKIELVSEFESQFESLFGQLLIENRDFIDFKSQSPIAYTKDKSKIIGGFNDLIRYITSNYSFISETKLEAFELSAKTHYKYLLTTETKRYSFLELSEFLAPIDKEYSLYSNSTSRTIVIELFYSVAPRTVINFLEISKESTKNKKGEKLSYKGCEVFRVIKNGYIQSGDLSHLEGGRCLYGEPFEDENYDVKHNCEGIVGMVKYKGKSHSNESQFYITLNPLTVFDGRFVAFGRVVKGMNMLRRLSEVKTYLQRPVTKVEIIRCGEYTG